MRRKIIRWDWVVAAYVGAAATALRCGQNDDAAWYALGGGVALALDQFLDWLHRRGRP